MNDVVQFTRGGLAVAVRRSGAKGSVVPFLVAFVCLFIYFGTLQAELLGFPQFPNPLEQDGQTDQTNRSLKNGEKHSDHGKRR